MVRQHRHMEASMGLAAGFAILGGLVQFLGLTLIVMGAAGVRHGASLNEMLLVVGLGCWVLSAARALGVGFAAQRAGRLARGALSWCVGLALVTAAWSAILIPDAASAEALDDPTVPSLWLVAIGSVLLAVGAAWVGASGRRSGGSTPA
jgi:hypothetical protein